MSVDATTVRRIAHLARIAVTDDEVPHLQAELRRHSGLRRAAIGSRRQGRRADHVGDTDADEEACPGCRPRRARPAGRRRPGGHSWLGRWRTGPRGRSRARGVRGPGLLGGPWPLADRGRTPAAGSADRPVGPGVVVSPGAVDRARRGPDQRVLLLARNGARQPGGAARPGRSSAARPLLRRARAHADQRPTCHSPRQVGG